MFFVTFVALALLPVAIGAPSSEGESNTDIEFVQRQLTGLYTVSPTIGDSNGGQCKPIDLFDFFLFFHPCSKLPQVKKLSSLDMVSVQTSKMGMFQVNSFIQKDWG